MKSKIFLLLFFLMYFYYAKGQESSVLSNGDWYEITTNENGIYKIDYVFLSQLGINLSNININSIKLFGNGGGMLPNLNSAFRFDDLIENWMFNTEKRIKIGNNARKLVLSDHTWEKRIEKILRDLDK